MTRVTAVSGPGRDAVQRRTLAVLVAVQVLSGAGLAAGITVGALLAGQMLGGDGLSGAATALFTGGSAAAAFGVGRLSQIAGRRPGLLAGYAVGATGGALVVVAATVGSVPLLLVALVLYGSGVATNLQARYAGADLARPQERGAAVSTVLVATTVGGVLGPNTVGLTGDLAVSLGTTALAGPFMLATVAYGLAALFVGVLLRPDPLLVARRLHTADAAQAGDPSGPQTSEDPPSRFAAGTAAGTVVTPFRLAAGAMILSQAVMVAVMTMTPIHLRSHGHGLAAAGLVISLHVAAMYLPSPLTGRLVDRWGRRPVIAAGGVTLVAAGALAAAAGASVPVLAVALVLLGLGWNGALVGGTALLTDTLPSHRRAGVQGGVDVGVALAGAGAGLGSGFVVAGWGYAQLSLAAAAVSLVLLLAVRPPVAAPDRARHD